MAQRRRTSRAQLLAALERQQETLDRLASIEQAQLALLAEIRRGQLAGQGADRLVGEAVVDHLTEIRSETTTARQNLQAVRMIAGAATLDEVSRFYATRQLSMIETLEAVRDDRLSLARFGDGEIRMMLRPEYRLRFQRNSAGLQAGLHDALSDPPEAMLVALPTLYHDRHWAGVWSDVWRDFHDTAGGLSRFGNAHVSRPIFFQMHGRDGVELWRSVWGGLRAAVVTGKNSRFELIPELFDGLASAEVLHTSSTDAFDTLPAVLDQLKTVDADVTFIALGPAGTVLAHQLAQQGRRALDIGHLSDSYLNVFHDGAWPEERPLSADPA